MSCGERADLLQAYVDGELDLVRSLEMEQHLSQCPDCTAAAESQRALQSALRDPAMYFEPPKHLEKRIRAELGTAERVTTTRRFGWRWLAAAAALPSMALAGALLVMSRTPSAGDLLDQEIVSAHVRSLLANHLTDVSSSDQHTVKPWFDGRLDFSPEVRDLASDGYPLVGGRLDYVGQRTVAALVYRRRQHSINVFVWPEPEEKGGGAGETSTRGYNLIRWSRSRTSYSAVSDLNLAELRIFVRDLQR
jgi:anti-sigma factor RsiW